MLIFLKLGGSLITEKEKPFTARLEIINRIGLQILSAIESSDHLEIIIGHGSGSFGHYAAKDLGTRHSVSNQTQWHGFQKVWYAAHSLNNIVVEAFSELGLPTITFSPSSAITTSNRRIINWNTKPIRSSIENGLIPIIYGDVVLDEKLGGIILSTEDLFFYLINDFNPEKILIAGKEDGVWLDYTSKKKLIPLITSENIKHYSQHISPSNSIDVTGGMQEKVKLMLSIAQSNPKVLIEIFSGEKTDNIYRALLGEQLGTRVAAT